MVLQGEEAIVYLYILNDKKKKFDVSKLEFSKNSGEFKKVEDEEDEGEEEDKKEEAKDEEKKEEIANEGATEVNPEEQA